MLTEEEKLAKYRAGLYKMPAPPVCTILWIEENWIEYIDSRGFGYELLQLLQH